MTLQLADGRKTFIDFRETAPLAATREHVSRRATATSSRTRARAVTSPSRVPGTVSGLEYVREKYGTLPRARADRAGHRARRKASCSTRATSTCCTRPPTTSARTRRARRSSSRGTQPFDAGASSSSPTSRARCATQPREAPTASTRARSPPRCSRPAAPAKASSRRRISTPTRPANSRRSECDYRGFHIVAAPPPFSGGVVLCEMLNVLEGYPLGDFGYGSARAVHFKIEAMRHAYVDRNHLLGDPDFVRNPDRAAARQELRAAIRAGIDPTARRRLRQLMKPGIAAREGTHTTHYSIVDRFGNAVAVTYTLNDWFGARVIAGRHRRAAQQRDGRLHREGRRRRTSTASCRATPTRSSPASGRSAR